MAGGKLPRAGAQLTVLSANRKVMTQQLQITVILLPCFKKKKTKNNNNNQKNPGPAFYYSLFNKALEMSASVIIPAGAWTSKWAPVTGKIIDFIQPIVSLL